MQEQFVIKSDNTVSISSCTLALLAGNDYFSYAIYSDDNNLHELKRFYLQQTTAGKLSEIINANPVLNEGFGDIVTAFDFDTNTLLPVDLNTGDNTPLLYLNEAGQQDHIIHEVVKEWGLANVYSIPYDLLNSVLTHFPSSKFWHAQSVQMKHAGKNIQEGCINLELRDKRFNVTVSKEDQLLLAKTYSYNAPADVLFYLLKICEIFGLDQETVQLGISGLIDRNSALFKTLYDYFIHISFKEASWQQTGEYPAHYFTLLNRLALCES